MNEQQLAAVEATGEVFVSAGAGTGKTAVLVERFVRAVCDRGLDVDSILVITYTRRAAGELRTRIRAELSKRGRDDLARRLDRRELLLVHPRSTRHIDHRSHHAGQSPPFGSWRTSPSWIRLASSCAFARAFSTDAQNASSSR